MNAKLGFNPFLKIWVKPRQTIRALVEYNLNYRFFSLCAVYGFLFLLKMCFNLGIPFFKAFISSLILSIPFGYIYFNLSSAFIFWIGKLIKGKASFKEIRAAIYWTSIPSALVYLLWIVLIILRGQDFFISKNANELLQISTIIEGAVSLVLVALSIWALLVFLHALGEVQGFSAWLALLNAFLGGLVLSVSIFIVVFIVAWGVGVLTRLS